MRATEVFEDISYYRWKKKEGRCEEGCFEIGKRHVHSFPHIRRVLNLEEGLKRVFGTERFDVEEKIDGYNVRVVSVDGRAFAFTRTGHIEPFATEFLRKSEVERLAERYVVCGEMTGATPFTRGEGWDAKFQVFDLVDGERFLGVGEKRDVLASYPNIEAVPHLGKYSVKEMERLKGKLDEMDAEGKEGIVMKSKKARVKYVLPKHEAKQFEEAWKHPFDLPAGFFYERALRACTAPFEVGEEASADPFKEFKKSIRQYISKGYVGEEFRVRVKSLTTWTDIKKRLRKSRTVRLKELNVEEREGMFYVTFEKIYNKTSAALSRWKSGKAFTD